MATVFDFDSDDDDAAAYFGCDSPIRLSWCNPDGTEQAQVFADVAELREVVAALARLN